MKYIFRCDKLVRDRIPELIQEKGSIAHVRTLDHQEHIHALKEKVFEEAEEIRQAATLSELIEEIADLREVLDALVMKLSIPKQEVDQVKQKKCMQKGGFSRGLYVSMIEVMSTSPDIALYLEKPEKYPLVTAKRV